MTAAHRLPGAILTPHYRGARAVASFNAAERHGATNQIQRIAGRTANPVGQLSGSANAAHGFCLAVGSAALFNAPQPQQEAARVGHAAGRQFNAADARSRATLTCRVPTSDAEVISRISARPAAPFSSTAADARSRATHLRAGWSPIVETHPCASRCSGVGPEMPARRSSARPAALFNGRIANRAVRR